MEKQRMMEQKMKNQETQGHEAESQVLCSPEVESQTFRSPETQACGAGSPERQSPVKEIRETAVPENHHPDTAAQEVHEGNNSGTPIWQADDIRGKEFFDNPELCAQFLRDYSGLEILKDVQPEDIEDVKLRYHLFDEVEYNPDAVKRIRLRSADAANAANAADGIYAVNGTNAAGGTNTANAANAANAAVQDMPMYIVSLIDHKSGVDYNVAMQFLRYEVCIWADWEKEMRDRGYGKSGQKSFRYPPVLPIIYYEGSGTWTADLHLSGRIAMAEMFSEYIPDFTYRVVRNHDYSNDELMKRADEMSLLMMLGKIHRAGDIEALRSIPPGQIDSIMKKASPAVVDILARTVWSLCRKMNLPENEAEDYVRNVKEGKMGYIFENMEKMDIQEERRKVAEERRKAAEARQETEAARQETEAARQETAEARQETEAARQETEAARQETEAARQETAEARQETEAARQETEAARQETEAARQETEAARQETAEARQETAEARQEAEETRQKLQEAHQEISEAHQELQNIRKILIETCKQSGATREAVIRKLCDETSLSENKAAEMIEKYWK